MAALGADITIVPSHGKGSTAELIARMRALVEELDSRDDVYWARQFENADALHGYARLGEELVAQLDGSIDAFCGGVGTAGMLMGVSRTLRAPTLDTRFVAVEPASSPIISQAISGSHNIEGVGAGFIPPLLDAAFYDTVMAVDEADAREMARRLAREEGIFCGTSSGMNVVAALAMARQLGPGHNIATVAVDTGLKYLAGGLFDA